MEDYSRRVLIKGSEIRPRSRVKAEVPNQLADMEQRDRIKMAIHHCESVAWDEEERGDSTRLALAHSFAN